MGHVLRESNADYPSIQPPGRSSKRPNQTVAPVSLPLPALSCSTCNSTSTISAVSQHYLGGFKEGVGASYSSSEQILTTFAQMGLAVETKEIRYSNDRPAV